MYYGLPDLSDLLILVPQQPWSPGTLLTTACSCTVRRKLRKLHGWWSSSDARAAHTKILNKQPALPYLLQVFSLYWKYRHRMLSCPFTAIAVSFSFGRYLFACLGMSLSSPAPRPVTVRQLCPCSTTWTTAKTPPTYHVTDRAGCIPAPVVAIGVTTQNR